MIWKWGRSWARSLCISGIVPEQPQRKCSPLLVCCSATSAALPPGAAAEDVQTAVYAIGKNHEFDDLKSWFKALYETLLGQSTGPRMGSFIILYGIEETKILIDRVLKGEDLGAA